MPFLFSHLFVGIYFFSISSYADSVGFQSGSQFWGYAIYGEVILKCTNSEVEEVVDLKCEDSTLRPNSQDFFVGPKGIQATEVELKVVQEDQTVRVRKLSYNSATNKSTSKFNLWMNSLLQKPLLAYGSNQVEYKLIRNNTSVNSGRFFVDVKYGGALICPSEIIITNSIEDCRQPYSVCQRYFADKNFCIN